MGDDARRRILERRARFVAAALGAAAAAANCTKAEPCLSAVPMETKPPAPPPADASVPAADMGTMEQPMPCLSEAPMPPPDAPKPRPCLKIAPPKDAGPQVCLDF